MANKFTVLFFGTPTIAARCLQPLLIHPELKVVGVVTQPDRPAGRGGAITASPVKVLAAEHQLPVLQPQSIRKEEDAFLTSVAALGPIDISVVVAFGQILPLRTLSIGRKGAVNLHASILPRWRGAAPLQRAILSGDKETGVALMKMEEGLDTGPVYSETRIPLSNAATFGWLHDEAAAKGAELLARDLPSIIRGEITAIPQSSEGVTYAQKISNEEALIDWTKSSEEISRHVRGLSPIPSAVTFHNGKRLKIFSATPQPSAPARSSPGTIVVISSTEVSVICGSGALSLNEVQLEGKKRMPIVEFLKGSTFKTGDLLK